MNPLTPERGHCGKAGGRAQQREPAHPHASDQRRVVVTDPAEPGERTAPQRVGRRDARRVREQDPERQTTPQAHEPQDEDRAIRPDANQDPILLAAGLYAVGERR